MGTTETLGATEVWWRCWRQGRHGGLGDQHRDQQHHRQPHLRERREAVTPLRTIELLEARRDNNLQQVERGDFISASGSL